MAELATVRIKTGPDTYITVNETDYDAFKFMEYTEPKQMQEPVRTPVVPIDISLETSSGIPIESIRKKRITQEII